ITACTCGLALAQFFLRESPGCSGHPAFPAPSCFEKGDGPSKARAKMRREKVGARLSSVIASAFLSIVMPRECGASRIPEASRQELRRLWNTGSPAFAGDDCRGRVSYALSNS